MHTHLYGFPIVEPRPDVNPVSLAQSDMGKKASAVTSETWQKKKKEDRAHQSVRSVSFSYDFPLPRIGGWCLIYSSQPKNSQMFQWATLSLAAIKARHCRKGSSVMMNHNVDLLSIHCPCSKTWPGSATTGPGRSACCSNATSWPRVGHEC